jgi:hypothetical protein
LARSVRPSALTTPAVTVCCNPSGLPIAMAIWPGLKFFGIGKAEGLQPGHVDLQDRNIGGGVGPLQLGIDRPAIRQRDFDILRHLDNMIISDDESHRSI